MLCYFRILSMSIPFCLVLTYEVINGFCEFGLFWQIKGNGHFLHLLIAHALWRESHTFGINVNLGSLAEHVNLVESIHHVETLGKYAMFLP